MTTLAKHAGPIHPGTGTDQSVHSGGGSGFIDIASLDEIDVVEGRFYHSTDSRIVGDRLQSANELADAQGWWKNETDLDGHTLEQAQRDDRVYGTQEPQLDFGSKYVYEVEPVGDDPWGGGEGYYDSEDMRPEGNRITRRFRIVKSIVKHYGPGPHPGTMSPQSVHGGGSGGAKASPSPRAYEWRSLDRRHSKRDGEIAEKLIRSGTDSAGSTAGVVKDEVVRSLFWKLSGDDAVREYASAYMRRYESEKIGIHYDNPTKFWVDSVVKGWAEMDEMELDAFNIAVADVFGEGYWPDRVSYDKLDEHLNIEGSDGAYAYRELAKAMYDETQSFLADGPDQYVFFRGLRGRTYSGELADSFTKWVEHYDTEWGGSVGSFPGMIFTDVQLEGRPAASWSASYSTAKEFAQSGVVLAVSVPKEAIISTARTGLGALKEDEVLLIDHGENVVTAISSSQTQRSYDETRRVSESYGGYGNFPSSSNARDEKIAWTKAYLDGFHNRGVWVDVEHPNPFEADTGADIERLRMGMDS